MFDIREEEPDDVAAIHEVEEAAFGQPLEADLVDRVRAVCPDILSLVALIGSRVVGHILFSPVSIEGGGETMRGFGLGPMAVHPGHQRRGAGSALVRAGLDRLERASCPFVVVLGHPDYYPRFGFVPASRHGVRSTWDVSDEVFMIRLPGPAPARVPAGVARYRPEFDEAT